MDMKSRLCITSSNSSPFSRLLQRRLRAAIIVELRVETWPDGLFSRHSLAKCYNFTLQKACAKCYNFTMQKALRNSACSPTRIAFTQREAVLHRAAAPNAAGFATGTAASEHNPSSGYCSRVGRARHVQSVTIPQCRRGFYGLGTDERGAGFCEQTHGGIVDGNEAAQVEGCDPGLLLCEASFVP